MKYKRLIAVLLALSLFVTGNPFNFDTVSGASVSLDYKLGDINQDDSISVEDAQIVLLAYVQIMAGMESGLTEQQTKAADINADKDVSVEDAQYILIYYVANTLSGTEITWEQILHPEAAASTDTTTSTKNITEPPIQQDGGKLCINGYYIEDIGNNHNAFIYFSKSFWDDILSNVDHPGIYIVDLGYGGTTLGQELNFLLDTLNFNYIDQNVLHYAYYDGSEDNINHSKYVAFNFKNIQDCFDVDIDYSKYIIDDYTGKFLNNADQAYREGWFDSFMDDNINNLPDNPTCLAILFSYDQGRLLNYDEINNKLDDMICNHIPEDILGFSYIK